mmetsp:Transcript_13869/g.15940  ORF Transcript_13869/g.15940 Transcript_13869/m.15940 type:complete len:97 (+) Transcript_13869:88-378(+)
MSDTKHRFKKIVKSNGREGVENDVACIHFGKKRRNCRMNEIMKEEKIREGKKSREKCCAAPKPLEQNHLLGLNTPKVQIESKSPRERTLVCPPGIS